MQVKSLVPVTEKALYQRINRKLRMQDSALKRARGRVQSALGDYFVVDYYQNIVREHHVDLEQLGRRLKALEEWEALSE